MSNLWRQVIIDHYKNPRNKGLSNEEGYFSYHIKNPSCGDEITIQTKVEGGKVIDVRHEGKGCSICCASASIMSELLKNKKLEDALNFTDNYLKMVSNDNYDESYDLDEAIVFEGVRDFPARVKCASIAWNAFIHSVNKDEK